ncbi:RNA-directed DNA polymerase, eukaryota [Tanacetum coccineum]|uniref:RNA-directed DNA polymerase, eukaryota n=1 Tax=Tanacetum coccineum TaxID=301880 RepID=A0ABQ5J8E8_9ASTR
MENSQSQQASTNASVSTSHGRKIYTNEDVVRIRPTTRKGDVWSNYDMCIMIDGVEKARCKKCMKFYNPGPNLHPDHKSSLIGSLYKVVTKILATRLSSIISGLISDVQTAFLPNRQILDGPFIINELLSWCKHKKQQAMVFKVDFAKAYDSIRWDFLEDVLRAFGFGSKWCSWIRGCLHSGMASVLLNGSPTSEFQFHCGLKQGDPLAPYLFILIMESLHLSLSRAIEAGIFKGIKIGSSLNISHLFYADDAVFIGEWSIANLSGITHILHCFSLLSGLSINLKKSHLLGVGIRSEDVNAAALYFGCSTMKTPFKYLGVMVGGNSSTLQAWDDTIGKLKARLSNWKLKTLSVGGRLTLLKSVLGSTPIYNMSIYKVPKSVLQTMESIRRNFFNGVQCDERKIVWIKWAKVLASKKYGGLGVSSFYALNRALLFKWVWRFISRDNSLWCRLIMSMHGSSLYKLSPFRYSTWKSIIREVHMLKDRGVDLISHCHIRVGNGLRTQFWNEVWIGDTQLRVMFPRIYALEINKDCTVADKLQFSVTSSLRRSVRGGVESSQLALLQTYIEGTLLSNMEDRWVWDLNGEGVFRVKDVRILLDECFLPKAPTATRWVKYVPIKINVFAWKVFLDRLPTRSNLQHRGVLVSDLLCPLCSSAQEDSSHLFFSCRLATDIVRLVCRWWNLSWTPLGSYADWLNWFNSIRLSSKVKDLLEGVLYITWWSVWMFRNQLLFSSKAPRKDVIFDDIVSRSFTWCLSRSDVGAAHTCIDKERQALLDFKAPLQVPDNRLFTWRPEEEDDCCQWSGVECDDQTGHVTALILIGLGLGGEISLSLFNLTYLIHLDLLDNSFHGTISKFICFMTNFTFLRLSKNKFTGTIPESICNMTQLIVLDLSENKFSGVIPESIGSLSNLFHLDLSDNSFYGTIPREFGNLTNLEVLYLDSLRSCRVENLDWLSSLSSLEELEMDGTSLAKANNWFDGNLSDFLNTLSTSATTLDTLDASRKVNEFSSILGLLKEIDLSSNNVTEQIPNEITNLHGLNMFSGEMPSSMSDMHSLNDLDVSFNNLSGRVPTSTQLQSFKPTRFTENAGLCGLPTTKKRPEDEGVPHDVKSGRDGYSTDELQRWFYVGGATGFVTGFWIVCSVLLLNRQGRRAFFHFHDSVKDWVYVTMVVFIAKWRRVARA